MKALEIVLKLAENAEAFLHDHDSAACHKQHFDLWREAHNAGIESEVSKLIKEWYSMNGLERALMLCRAGMPDTVFRGTEDGINYSASADLKVIGGAWGAVDFEAEADGYGPGMGTHGDWSGIRDSSPEAIKRMLAKALAHFDSNR